MSRLRARASRPGLFAAVAAALVALAAGCTSIPREALAEYSSAFDQAKTGAEEVLLTARASAEIVADHPDNPAAPSARLAELRLAEKSITDRLLALSAIDAYNDLLIALATPGDPAAVEASANKLLSALSALNSSTFSSIAAAAGPYGAAIGLVVSIIDDLIRQKEFREVVEAGAPLIRQTLDILIVDVDDLAGVIGGQRFELSIRPARTELRQKGAVIQTAIRDSDPNATPIADPAMVALVDRYTAARAKAGEPPLSIPLAPVPTPGPNDQAAIDRERARRAALVGVLAGVEANVTQYEELADRITGLEGERQAYAKVLDEHRALLRTVQSALDRVRVGAEQRSIEPAIQLAAQALRLRQALITARMKERGQ